VEREKARGSGESLYKTPASDDDGFLVRQGDSDVTDDRTYGDVRNRDVCEDNRGDGFDRGRRTSNERLSSSGCLAFSLMQTSVHTLVNRKVSSCEATYLV